MAQIKDDISDLIEAIGYALDAGNPERDWIDRRECRDIAEKKLLELIQRRRLAKENSEPSRVKTDKTK